MINYYYLCFVIKLRNTVTPPTLRHRVVQRPFHNRPFVSSPRSSGSSSFLLLQAWAGIWSRDPEWLVPLCHHGMWNHGRCRVADPGDDAGHRQRHPAAEARHQLDALSLSGETRRPSRREMQSFRTTKWCTLFNFRYFSPGGGGKEVDWNWVTEAIRLQNAVILKEAPEKWTWSTRVHDMCFTTRFVKGTQKNENGSEGFSAFIRRQLPSNYT